MSQFYQHETSQSVIGPSAGGSTDNAIVRWDGTTGTMIQNSGVLINDSNLISVPTGSSAGIEFGTNNNQIYNDTGTDDLIIQTGGVTAITVDGSTQAITLAMALGPTSGGTGLDSYVTGDMIYASATDTLSALPLGMTNYVLSNNGTIPVWVDPSSLSGTVTGPGFSTDNAIVRWDGTTGTLIQNSGVIIDDSDNVSQVQNLVFDTSPATPGTAEGSLYWDATDHTLAVQGDEADVTLQVGQENQIRVRNESGSLISNGQLVYVSGAEGAGENRPLIDLAQADVAATATVLGIATHDIENNTYGYVTSFGLVRQLDTSSFTAGDSLYLSATVAGAITNVEPASPNLSKPIGYAININATTGTILVSISPDSQAPAGDATELTVQCRKDSAGTINAGEVVYQTGYNAGQEVILVELADADDATKMPALGIARDTFTNSATGTVVISGLLTGQNTASYSVGDQLFVSTTAGALTSTRPTAATELVQKMGQVIRSNITNGVISVVGAGRTNDIPNRQSDAYFRIADDGDMTKLIQFQASGITTGTTRTFTAPDASGTLALATGLTQYGHAYASDGNTITSTAAATNGQLLIGSTGVAPVLNTLTAPASGLTITNGAGSITFALSGDLGGLEAITGTGVVVRSAADTYVTRTLTGTANEIDIANGDGVAGAPTFTLSDTIDIGDHTSLEIPNSATPTVNADGEIAIDTTVADFSHGIFKYYAGEELGIVAMPIAQFTSPTDTYVPSYNATNDEFELVDPSGFGGGGGAWVWVSTTTVSSDATIDFTGLSGSGARFVWYNLLPATDNTDLYVTVRENGSGTWDSTHYMWNDASTYAVSSSQDAGSDGAAQWELMTGVDSIGNAAGELGCGGFIEVYSLNDASNPAWAVWHGAGQRNASGSPFFNAGGGMTVLKNAGGQADNIDAIRFAFSSGNLASGTIVQYRLVTS